MHNIKDTIAQLRQGTRVAIVGHRGIPNSYGGFETFAEKLSERLVSFGARVTAYCRSNYFTNRPAEFKGVRLVYIPTIPNKFLDTFVHTFLSVCHIFLKNTASVVVIVNVGNAPFAALARIFGKKVIFCVDGLDWERKKWGRFAKWYLRTCSYFAKYAAHEIVTDAGSVQEFYSRERQAKSTLIAYGTEVDTKPVDAEFLFEAGVEYKKYFLYVARFEPENNPLMVVDAYIASKSTLPLVMIGDNRYDAAYVEKVKKAGQGKVIFLGYVFGSRYKALLKGALAYVRAAEVGGASPALIEAMGREVCVVASDKPENREVLAGTGILFPLNAQDLARVFSDITADPSTAITLGRHAIERAMQVYSWDTITFEYCKIIARLSSPKNNVQAKPEHNHTLSKRQRILIVGAGGMLGKDLYEHLQADYRVLATSRTAREGWLVPLDALDFDAYEKAVATFKPHVIIHAAALTNLEACSKDISAAYAINAQTVKYAADLSVRYHAKLVFISSSNVFDGAHESFDDAAIPNPNPDNIYGLTKFIGERLALYYGHETLVVRSGWMMGGGKARDQKFVGKIVEQILTGEKKLRAVNDKFGSITYTRDMAANIDVLLQHGATGTYNMTCPGMASRFEVAQEIVRALGREKEITVESVDSNYFAKTFSATRPASENIISTRLAAEGLSVMRPWQAAVRDYMERDFPDAFAKIPVRSEIADTV